MPQININLNWKTIAVTVGLITGVPTVLVFWGSLVVGINYAEDVRKVLANSKQILVMLENFTEKRDGELAEADKYAARMAILDKYIEGGYLDELEFMVDQFCDIHPEHEDC